MDFYQRLAEPKPPRPPTSYKVVIASQPTDDEYSAARDFWTYRAFARACPDHGIPVDTWIPSEVADLAMQAFRAGSEPQWEAARQLLKTMEATT